MICSHWLLVMLFNYIRDTFGNMFVNTKPSRILPHVTLHESCRSLVARYRLSIEGVRKGIPCPWPQALLGFLFLPKSEHSSLTALWESGNLPSKQEKMGRKQPYLGSGVSNCWQQCALGDRNVAENPALTSLVWAWAAEIDNCTLKQRYAERHACKFYSSYPVGEQPWIS